MDDHWCCSMHMASYTCSEGGYGNVSTWTDIGLVLYELLVDSGSKR